MHNVDGSGGPNDMSRLDDDSGANTYAPNTCDALCNYMDATMLANNPNRKVNASKPMMGPRTNHR